MGSELGTRTYSNVVVVRSEEKCAVVGWEKLCSLGGFCSCRGGGLCSRQVSLCRADGLSCWELLAVSYPEKEGADKAVSGLLMRRSALPMSSSIVHLAPVIFLKVHTFFVNNYLPPPCHISSPFPSLKYLDA